MVCSTSFAADKRTPIASPSRRRPALEELADGPHDPAAVLREQLGELAERAFAADVADDLAELVLRQPGLLGCRADRVARRAMGLAERGDRLLDLLGGEADLGREI